VAFVLLDCLLLCQAWSHSLVRLTVADVDAAEDVCKISFAKLFVHILEYIGQDTSVAKSTA